LVNDIINGMKEKIKRIDYLIVGVVAFVYYAILASKTYSWCFASGDSGDWLASSMVWMNSQPYGSPLYILLGHFVNALPFSNLPLKMTLLLSVIPASITVAVTYLIVKKITSNYKIAIVSTLVLLGAVIPLSQSTILEEYAIASMFVTLAFYFYIQDKKKLTILFLGLGSAIHIIVVCISVLWLIVHFVTDFKNIKSWLKYIWIYILVGILPYSLALILMYADTPRFLSGHLSWSAINNYLSSTDTIGSLSVWEAPKRLHQFVEVVSVSFGLALIPLSIGFKSLFKENKNFMVALATIIFTLWLYLTNNDPTTYTFLDFGFPLIVCIVALGLFKINKTNLKIVGIGACCLIFLNAFFFNANTITNEKPLATQYEQSLKDLPDGSFVICFSGGNYTLCNYYVLAQGKQVIPLFYSGTTPQKIDALHTPRYTDYKGWIDKHFDVKGEDTMQQVKYLLSQNRNVFITKATVLPEWSGVFSYSDYSDTFGKVTGVNWDN
jgi:hypothetical protein